MEKAPENNVYHVEIQTRYKPFDEFNLLIQSDNGINLVTKATVKGETLPIISDNQTGVAKKEDSLDNLVAHLEKKIQLNDDERVAFKRLIREKMYFKVAYFVKLLYNENKEKITYNDLCNLFYFDNFLRMSLNRLLPSIEQFAKSTLNSYLLEEYGDSQIYNNEKIYKTNANKDKRLFNQTISTCITTIKEVKKSNEAVRHHVQNHGGYIPMWIFFDTLTFGQFNMLVNRMEKSVLSDWTKYLSEYMDVTPRFVMGPKSIPSHLQTVQILRNTSFHLSRLYGKVFTYNPSIQGDDPYWTLMQMPDDSKDPSKQIHSLFTGLVSSSYFYSCMSDQEISHWNKFVEKLDNKMSEIRFINPKGYMGFPKNWKDILIIK
ncbi:Abi family protein [Leuconostoc suionicum]|uniref:Abi family protein n=1 Tax=Leuconostoc suionicum TaxID=1511761 RepID=UPI0024AE09B8|nr:Abi family protein [Leuconostoc suionicum]MDI6522878.1 Abi family protein [Leuconostoc suionicum]